MSTLTRAIILAAQYHDGQEDKGGSPYILHPLRLMLRASTEEEQIAALLHDIVEDTPLTHNDLRIEGFNENVLSALDCLTRRANESYENFIERINENPLARRVKLLDLEDNSDLSRIGSPTSKDLERVEKYKRAIDILKRA